MEVHVVEEDGHVTDPVEQGEEQDGSSSPAAPEVLSLGVEHEEGGDTGHSDGEDGEEELDLVSCHLEVPVRVSLGDVLLTESRVGEVVVVCVAGGQ